MTHRRELARALDTRADVSRCKSCGAPMLWKRTVNGKPIPLDAEPNPKGNLFLDGLVAVHVTKAGPPPGAALFTTHFATCPNAGGHRKPASPVIEERGTA